MKDKQEPEDDLKAIRRHLADLSWLARMWTAFAVMQFIWWAFSKLNP